MVLEIILAVLSLSLGSREIPPSFFSIRFNFFGDRFSGKTALSAGRFTNPLLDPGVTSEIGRPESKIDFSFLLSMLIISQLILLL